MATHYIPDDARDRAVHAARQRLAAGERPIFHVRFENIAQVRDDPFGWFVWVLELPDIYATGPTARQAVAAVRASIAARVDMPADTFEVIEGAPLRAAS
jgi:hypothetical protein